VLYTDASSYAKLSYITFNGSSFSVSGTSYTFTGYYAPLRLQKIDSTKVVVFKLQSTYYIKASVCTWGGSSWSVGTEYTFESSEGWYSGRSPQTFDIDTNKFVFSFFYSSSSDTFRSIAFTVSGNTISLGSGVGYADTNSYAWACNLTTNTFMQLVTDWTPNRYLYASVVTASGTTLTRGSLQLLDGTTECDYPICVQIDTNTALIAYRTTGSPFNIRIKIVQNSSGTLSVLDTYNFVPTAAMTTGYSSKILKQTDGFVVIGLYGAVIAISYNSTSISDVGELGYTGKYCAVTQLDAKNSILAYYDSGAGAVVASKFSALRSDNNAHLLLMLN
jgi:hypothetical protein